MGRKANNFLLRNKILDPQGPVFQRWIKIFMVTCLIGVSVDPLFFYIPVINDNEKCLDFDGSLKITACVLRSFFDLVYILRIILQFQTGFRGPSSEVFGRVELIGDPKAIVKRYLLSDFIIDILSVIPLPQMIVMKSSYSSGTTDLLKIMIFIQYLPRLTRIYLLYNEVPRRIVTVTTIWPVAAFHLFAYMLACHVIGSSWYLLSVDSELRCWHKMLKNVTIYNHPYLSCGQQSQTIVLLLSSSCAFIYPDEIKDSAAFNFGIFIDALTSHMVLSTTGFIRKLFYCFWWGLRNISSFGQNLKTSTYMGEMIFAIFISIFSLVLISILIGNMQKYLQSRIVRVEEMMVKKLDTERWMSHRKLPEQLRDRIRRYENYKWQENGGVDEEVLIRNLPKDLRRDVKRHLCMALLKQVPLFEKMDAQLLDAVCKRLKPVLYTEKSYIFCEGEPVDEMLFITQGNLATMTTDGGRTGFFNSVLLKAGDFCGEELLTWAFDPKASSNLPISTRTVETISEVEAFALMVDDVKFVVSQFQRLHSTTVQHIFRFYSQQWRTWAACYIQKAWHRYRKKKMEMALLEAEARLATRFSAFEIQTPTLDAENFPSSFAANASQSRLSTLRCYSRSEGRAKVVDHKLRCYSRSEGTAKVLDHKL